jgi:uncharacterized surface anchored protein
MKIREIREINPVNEEQKSNGKEKHINKTEKHIPKSHENKVSTSISLPQTGINSMNGRVELVGISGLFVIIFGIVLMRRRVSKWLD